MSVGVGRQLSTVLYRLGGGRRAVPRDARAAGRSGDVGAVHRVVAQLGHGGATQADPTTCGSAALVVVAAAGDPILARWLATGTLEGEWPVELTWLDRGDAEAVARENPRARFIALQQAVKRASLRRGLGLLPWPGALGTPPWGAARVARFGEVRYTHRLVVDSRADQSGPILDHVVAMALSGYPVLLYTGGDSRAGLGAAVPRHVVVLTSPDGTALETYEPGSGRMHAVSSQDLSHGGVPRAAYGGWSHVTWAVLPQLA